MRGPKFNQPFLNVAGYLLAIGLAFSSMLAAQAPSVTAVVNQVHPDSGLSPGVLAWVRGTNFTEMASVKVGGLPAAVLE